MKKILLISACCLVFGATNAEVDAVSSYVRSKIMFEQLQAGGDMSVIQERMARAEALLKGVSQENNELKLEEPQTVETVGEIESSIARVIIVLDNVCTICEKDNVTKEEQNALIEMLEPMAFDLKDDVINGQTVKMDSIRSDIREVLTAIKSAKSPRALKFQKNIVEKKAKEIVSKINSFTRNVAKGKVNRGIFEGK